MKSEDLLGQFKAGDPKAFNAIFDMHYPELRYYSIKLTKSQFDGEEIALDSFKKLYNKHNAFESLDKIRSFLYIVARNASFNFLDKEKTKRKREMEYSQSSQDWEADERETRLQTEVLKQIIENVEKYLPPKYRQIVKMRYVDGKSQKEIAEELKLSESNVSYHHGRAIRMLVGMGIDFIVIISLAFAFLFKFFLK